MKKHTRLLEWLCFLNSMKFMNYSLANLVKNLGKEDFHNLCEFFNNRQYKLLLRKEVFLYNYFDSMEKLNETELHAKEKSYSKMNNQHISNKDFECTNV